MRKRPDNIALLFFFSAGIVTALAAYSHLILISVYIAAAALFILSRKSRLFVTMFIAGSGIFGLHNHSQFKTRDAVELLRGREMTVRGRITEVSEYGISSSVVISADSVQVEGMSYSLRARFSAYLSRTGLRPGDRVTVSGKVKPFEGPLNKYETDRKFASVLNYTTAEIADAKIAGLERADSGFLYMINFLQDKITGIFDRRLSYRSGNFLSAIMLGRKSRLESSQIKEFADSGTIHLLAVSGLHVGFVVLLLGMLNSFLHLKKWPHLILNSTALVFYAIFTGGSPSVVRAVLMAIILMLSRPLARKVRFSDVIGTAGLISLSYEPNQVFRPGFILSFAAVISISFTHEPLSRRLNKVINTDNYLIRKIAEGLLLSASVTIGLLPFVLNIFGRYNFVSILSNLFLIPLTGAAFMSGILLLATDSIGIIAAFISDIINLLVKIITFITGSTAGIELFTLNRHFDIWITAALVMSIAAVFYIRQYKFKLIFTSAAILVLSIKAINVSNDPTLYIFKTSSGRCAVLKNRGENILFASKLKTSDINRILIPYLLRSNISGIDFIITENEWYETEEMISALDMPVKNVVSSRERSFASGSYGYINIDNPGGVLKTATSAIGFRENFCQIVSGEHSFTLLNENPAKGIEFE
jgi:competence protein ComEC